MKQAALRLNCSGTSLLPHQRHPAQPAPCDLASPTVSAPGVLFNKQASPQPTKQVACGAGHRPHGVAGLQGRLFTRVLLRTINSSRDMALGNPLDLLMSMNTSTASVAGISSGIIGEFGVSFMVFVHSLLWVDRQI
eukprot:COSAG02_NODE_508_length_20916_cov_162.483691_14_plen_136_part_00